MGNAKDKNKETTTTTATDLFGTELTNTLGDIVNGDYSNIFTVKTADGQYIDSSKFRLAKKMGNVTDKVIANNELKVITNRIFGINELVKHSARLVAVELNKANNLKDEAGNSILQLEGFKNVGEYAYYLFGIKDKTANQYVRIARLFYDDFGNMVDPRLPKLSTSQCIPLLARVDDESTGDIHSIIEWYTPDDDGNRLLFPDMGANKIKERLDSLDKGYIDSHGRSLISAEERKERKEAEKAEKARKEESSGPEESTASEEKPFAEKVYTPEQKVCAMYLQTLSALSDLTEKATDENKPAMLDLVSKLEALKAEMLAIAGIEA